MPDPLTPAAPADRATRLTDVRATLRGLTTRGRCFVAGGVTAGICGVLLGERDLIRVGAVVVLLAVVTVAVVARARYQLGLERTLSSPVVEVDRPVTVHLEVTNLGRRTGRVLAEELVPWALGHRPRFVVDAVAGGGSQLLEYQVRAETRGTYRVGPLQVRVTDPFGLLALDRTFSRTATLVVVPAVEELGPIDLGGSGTTRGDDRPRPFSAGSVTDAGVRDYRYGDDLRRVHWPSTARTGEVMVRREEQPWQTRCTLFLDNRAIAHRGAGPGSSLERAVTATASIAAHLTRRGFEVRLVSADGDSPHLVGASDEVGSRHRSTLEFLAALPASSARDLAPAAGDARTGDEPAGIFIAVLGDLTDHDRDALARHRRRDSASYAVALDVDTWVGRPPGAGHATSWLRQHGWHAAGLGRGGSLPVAWAELGR